MGVVASQFRKCIPGQTKRRPQTVDKSIQILVVGDSNIFKNLIVYMDKFLTFKVDKFLFILKLENLL